MPVIASSSTVQKLMSWPRQPASVRPSKIDTKLGSSAAKVSVPLSASVPPIIKRMSDLRFIGVVCRCLVCWLVPVRRFSVIGMTVGHNTR